MLKTVCHHQQPIYHLSSSGLSSSIFQSTKRSKTKTKNDQSHTQVIEDLNFPVASNKICVSNNQQYIAAVGIYPPELRVYDVNELALKFSRRLDSEVVDFRILSDDYKKLVLLQTDRTLEFHAQGGVYYKHRIPKFGYHLEYLTTAAELLIVGSYPSIYRLNLERGCFEEETKLNSLTYANKCIAHKNLPVVYVAGHDGIIEAFDTRQWKLAATLKVQNEDKSDIDVTALALSPDEMTLGVGTSKGISYLYDIRSSKPYMTRNQRNGFPIRDLQLLPNLRSDSSSRIIAGSLDQKNLKFWEVTTDEQSTEIIASLHAEAAEKRGAPGSLNKFCVYPQSGLVFIAQDNPTIGTYFVPRIGLAPRWYSYLDNMTEEMEQHELEMKEAMGQDTTTQQGDQKFVTRLELEQLQASHLIGTNILRPYMHGFFIPMRLYKKHKTVRDMMAYEKLRSEKIQTKLERRKAMRIKLKKPIIEPLVNKELAASLSEKAQSTNERQSKVAQSILSDERFEQLFTNPEFSFEEISIPK